MTKWLANVLCVFFTGKPEHVHTYSKWNVKSCDAEYNDYMYRGVITVCKICSECGDIVCRSYYTKHKADHSKAESQLPALRNLVCKVLQIEETP